MKRPHAGTERRATGATLATGWLRQHPSSTPALLQQRVSSVACLPDGNDVEVGQGAVLKAGSAIAQHTPVEGGDAQAAGAVHLRPGGSGRSRGSCSFWLVSLHTVRLR